MKYILVLLLLLPALSFAKTETTSGAWLGTFTKRTLTNDFSLWAETQVRYNFDLGGTAQVLYRAGVLQSISENHGLGYLYGFIQSGNSKEHRYTLQHTMNYGDFSGLNLSHRARLEGRFVEDNPKDTSRFRYLFKLKKEMNTNMTFVVWNEVFLNLQERAWTGNDVFDRNRLFIGLNKPLWDAKIEFGYLNQFTPRDAQDTMEHVFVLYFPL